MRKLLTMAVLLAGLSAQAQLIWNPFGFYAYEREDLARNKVTTIYEYTVSAEEEDAYGQGYMPGDSLYAKRFSIHASGWLIEVVERDISYEEAYPSGTRQFVYSGPGGKVSRMEYETVDGDGHKVIYEYNAQGVLTKRNVVQIDPVEERFENKKGVITASQRFTTYPTYDEEGEFAGGVAVPSGRSDYLYDKSGRLEEWKSYDVNMSDDEQAERLTFSKKMMYTAEGRVRASESYEYYEGPKVSELTWRLTYSYNDKNLLTEVKQEDIFEQTVTYRRYVYVFAK